jgi:hypothetical protein
MKVLLIRIAQHSKIDWWTVLKEGDFYRIYFYRPIYINENFINITFLFIIKNFFVDNLTQINKVESLILFNVI